jgi:TIR domain-containing protein
MTNHALSSVYVSYKHEGESKDVVECLKLACEARKIKLTIDQNALRYGESIRGFMRQLGAGKCVIVVLSDGYLKSENCMFELLEIEKNRDIRQRAPHYP